MISFKSIQTSYYTFTRHNSCVHIKRLSNTKKYSILCLSKSNDSDSDDSSPQGDTRKQELLVRIAQLQAQKVRLTDFLDERSEYLTQFAEEANTEFDKIGEDALKGLEEAGDRVCSCFFISLFSKD